jgi:hypothetical protein
MIPLGFPPCSRWRIVAPLAVLFSLRAIIAVTRHEWELRPLQKYELAGIRLRPRRHPQGLVSPSDFQRNCKVDQYGIWGQIGRKKVSSY